MQRSDKQKQNPRPGSESAGTGDKTGGDDAIVPFEVAPLDIRGRVVQLGPALDTILARHAYPEPVSCLLAEAMVLTAILGSSLKFEGRFILQTASDGPVDRLICDFTPPSSIRAFACFDEKQLQQLATENRTSPPELLGKGTLALTVDQGMYMERYQGLVALDGSSLEDIADNYFRQSEQIQTRVRLGVARPDSQENSRQNWRAGGLFVQSLPRPAAQQDDTDDSAQTVTAADRWREAEALAATIETFELTDPEVGPERLLYRLFHQHGVRVFKPQPVIDRCSCSRERIHATLSGFSAEEIRSSIENGKISVTCEFCSTVYDFNPEEFIRTD